MYELEKTKEVTELIEKVKSGSGVCGPKLAQAHIRLGKLFGDEFLKLGFVPEETTVVAVMRGGIFFAQGIYMSMGCRFDTYHPKLQEFVRPETKKIILADSVINTGKTIKDILGQDIYAACITINQKAVPKFEEKLFTVRISENSFVGGNVKKQVGNLGPDTTRRIFNLI